MNSPCFIDRSSEWQCVIITNYISPSTTNQMFRIEVYNMLVEGVLVTGSDLAKHNEVIVIIDGCVHVELEIMDTD